MSAALIGCTIFTIDWLSYNGRGAPVAASICLTYYWYIYGKNLNRRTLSTLRRRQNWDT
jgi:hypothetical protein